jgi:hypothetical protein
MHQYNQFWYNGRMTRGTDLIDADLMNIASLLGSGYSTHEIGEKLGMPKRTFSTEWQNLILSHLTNQMYKRRICLSIQKRICWNIDDWQYE